MADVTVEEQVAAAVAATAEATGRIDGLFACAGGSLHLGSVLTADVDAVRATIDLNLTGSVICVKQGGLAMQAQGGPGSIVLMSSGAGRFPHPHLWAYGVSKAGICFLAETAAEELGPLGIRVNAVAPGIIADELMAFITAGGPLLDDYLAQMPLGRVGTVEDVAAAVRYLHRPRVVLRHRRDPRRRRWPPPAARRRLLPPVRGLSRPAGNFEGRGAAPAGCCEAYIPTRSPRRRPPAQLPVRQRSSRAC